MCQNGAQGAVEAAVVIEDFEAAVVEAVEASIDECNGIYRYFPVLFVMLTAATKIRKITQPEVSDHGALRKTLG